MKITLLKGKKSFLFDYNGNEQEVLFSDIVESHSWKSNKMISIVHNTIDEYGNRSITTLNRNVFLETMKEGDEEYHRARGAWELNTTIHKLYAILDGKDVKETEEEIANVSAQYTAMVKANREFNNEQVVKIYELEKTLPDAKTEAEKEKITKKIEKLKAERKVYSIPQEMKKMYFAARDSKKPHINLSNVSPVIVGKEYDNLRIA